MPNDVDRFVMGYVDFTDTEELRKAFVESVALNVNGVHEIRFVREAGPVGSASHCVRVQFRNSVGCTCAVDDVLDRRFNMLDWRVICDKITERVLEIRGRHDMADADWPTPRPRVTFASDPDEDDIVTEVEIAYDLPFDVWDAMRGPDRGARGRTLGEVCPLVERETLQEPAERKEPS